MAKPLTSTQPIADWTLYDKAAAHWGAAMTIGVVTSMMRQCELGQRDLWCDLLSELLEGDPHAHSVLKKCYSSISNHRWELIPPRFEDEGEQYKADIVARETTEIIAKIPNWKSRIYQLLWGHFTGASAHEVMWRFNGKWSIRELRHVPSRRLGFDDSFELYLTDGSYSTTGIPLGSLPGKFLAYVPCVTGEVPTREGLGRILAYWLGFGRWATRDFLTYVERFGKPLPLAVMKTGRVTSDETDKTLANSLVQNIGRGTQFGAVVPDTIDLQFPSTGGSGGNGGAKVTVHGDFLDRKNAEVSKAVLGGTLTTEVGSSGGNRALGERQGVDQQEIIETIASQLDEAITAAIVVWLVRLNFGEDAEKYTPQYHTMVETDDDQLAAAEVLKILVDSKVRLPANDVRERFGWREPSDDEEVVGGPMAAPQSATPATPPDDGEDDGEDDTEDEPDATPPRDTATEDDTPDDGEE